MNHKGLKFVSKVSYFLFPEEFNFNFYNAFCQNLGGRIPGSDSQEGFHEVMDQLENIVVPEIHEKCLHASGALMVWVGVTDAYNVNIRQTEGVIHSRSFKFKYLSGRSLGRLNNEGCSCVGRTLDVRTTQRRNIRQLCEDPFRQVSRTFERKLGQIKAIREWNDEACEGRFCSACSFSKRMNLTIRGLCPSDTKLMEGNFDSEYFIDGFRNNKAHWRGLGKSHIYYIKERKQWKLESFYDEDVKFAVLVADDSDPYAFYPLGRLYLDVCEF